MLGNVNKIFKELFIHEMIEKKKPAMAFIHDRFVASSNAGIAFHYRTTNTGQPAWCNTRLLTLPSTISANWFRPRLPTMIRS